MVDPVTISTLLFLALAAPQQEAAPQPQEHAAAPAVERPSGIPIHGSLSARYRLRATDDDRDQDLYEVLSVDAGEAQRHPVTGHLFVRATEDLDGDMNTAGFAPFDSITDTFESRVNSRLYAAYLDVHRLGPLQTLRAGRQWIHDTPVPFHLDGVVAETIECKNFGHFHAGMYGGLPVHLYESSPSGDLIAGTYIEASPWKGMRARLDYARVVDENVFGEQRNDLFGLGLTQRLGEKLQLQGRYGMLDGEGRDLLLRGVFTDAPSDLQFQLSYTQLFNTQRELAIDLDSFFLAARAYVPYGQIRALIAKGFGPHFVLQGGIDLRELENDTEEGPFNREFRRYFLTPTVNAWPWPPIAWSVTVEMWDVPGQDDGDIATAGFEMTVQVSPDLKLAAGSAYTLYTFDELLNEERENVRTLYARATAALRQDLKGELGVQFEDAEIDDFWTLKVGLTQSF